MNTAQRIIVSSFAVAAFSAGLQAEVKLPAILSDHIVLQREAAVPIWGTAEAGEKVSVQLGDQTKSATAGSDGRWMVKLDSLKAASTAQELKVTSDKGSAITIKDVLVGEVWLGSGQSNMAFTVSNAKDFESEKAAATTPEIRMFTERSNSTEAPVRHGTGAWVVCSPETVGTFSATAYFFGREIHKVLQLPVGLINSSVGGTPIESWIDAEAQHAEPGLKDFFAAPKTAAAPVDPAAEKAKYEAAMAQWKEDVKKAKAEKTRVPRPPVDTAALRQKKGNTGGLYNGKIAPLIPFAIRGALWYQGEANSTPTKAPFYQVQLPLLVNDWRKKWGYDFPFAWVQLPNFKSRGDGWCLVREAMLKTLSLPKTGMAITLDVGEPGNIHPKNKQAVGHRLALWALGTVYGKDNATSGPLLTSHAIKGSEIVLTFSHADGGLKSAGGPLLSFVIAGEDKVWHDATARIEGDKVVLSCPEVPAPVAARYAWKDDPIASLFNGEGLPASPFRTDAWALEFKPEPPARNPRTRGEAPKRARAKKE